MDLRGRRPATQLLRRTRGMSSRRHGCHAARTHRSGRLRGEGRRQGPERGPDMRIGTILAVGLIAVPQIVLAQDRDPDILYVTGAAQSGPGIRGDSGEIEWLRTVSPRESV